jgi:cysteine desulfurase/selenocysteine lyase
VSAFDFSPRNLDAEFPVRRHLLYFNHAAVAPLPRRVADAMTAHVANVRDRGAADWRSWYAQIESTREGCARFLGARKEEIAFLPNTSWGLNLVAQSYPWKAGDNVVSNDMEFPSNAYPWQRLSARGIECRLARSREGRLTADAIAAEIDARTRIVAVSWVAFHNGWVAPLGEIGRLCRERGILFVVDGIQGLGALPADVERDAVDVLVADSHKWLFGPEGSAIFYVREGARDRVPAWASGWWNNKSAKSYLDYGFEPYEGARRYEPGTLPTDHLAGIAAAIELLEAMGRDTVRARILELVGALREGLAERGWRIATPEPLASGILAAAHPSQEPRPIAKALEQRSVIVAPREGAVRFSPHAGNDLDQVERVLAEIDALG